MPSTGEPLPAIPGGQIVLVHSAEVRRSVNIVASEGQAPEGLTPADMQAIIAAAVNGRDRLLLRVLWAMGGRSSEALALRAADIRRDALVLTNRMNSSRPVKTVFLAGGEMDLPGNCSCVRRTSILRTRSRCSAPASKGRTAARRRSLASRPGRSSRRRRDGWGSRR